MNADVICLAEACGTAVTGDLWLFRGTSPADRMIRLVTNAPVNHVGMAVVIDDLPPLMWHAELGKGLRDVWTGTHHRGVQLHDLSEAVVQWHDRYAQDVWVRQLEVRLDAAAKRAMDDAVLRTIARLDGTPFPSTAALVSRWARGRVRRDAGAELTYCAEVVAATYAAAGLLEGRRPTNSYDPGTFWSGEYLDLQLGARLGDEVAVHVPIGGR